MKNLAFVAFLCMLPLGCSKSSDPTIALKSERQRPQEPLVESSAPATTEVATQQSSPPVEPGPTDTLVHYPEKDEVLAILYRARDLLRKSQFQSAMELVTHALVVDPQSPTAQSMERELTKILQRLQGPENKQRTGLASRSI